MRALILIIVCISMTAFSHASAKGDAIIKSAMASNAKKAVKLEIILNVEIGCAKKRCAGFGICGLGISYIDDTSGAEKAIPYTVGDEIVALEYLKLGDVRGESLISNFKLGYFLMEEAFSTTIKTKVGTLKLNWPAGKHPAVKTKDGWKVSPHEK